QAEEAALSGDASAVKPGSLWTGESLFGGTGYADLGSGSSAGFEVASLPRSLVLPVLDLAPGSEAVTTFRAGDRLLGRAASGDVGAQGDSPAPGALLPVTLSDVLPDDATQLTATTSGGSARLDAVMLEPLVSRLVLGGDGHGTALLSSASEKDERAQVRVPGSGPARIETYDGQGNRVDVLLSPARTVPVTVPAGGFAIVRR
ncbi:MAG TPA: hypothetical protein VLA97_02305, partial [Nocardioidaceae bacterium]|nr:hypothetical protein [Nocardioidaceae bacterium]